MALIPIPEKFLREVWQHRLFSSSALATSDGARVVVRFPGQSNPDGGPDFTGALIRIGGVLYRGDIEVHIRAGSWHAHRHGFAPHYNGVILHVVFSPARRCPPARTAAGRRIPLLVLSPYVDPFLYGRWSSGDRRSRNASCGRDRRPLPRASVRRRINALGARRIARRVRSLGRRFRQILEERAMERGECSPTEAIQESAWDQILYESVLEGMGYGGNRFPFLALARSVSLPLLRAHGLDDTVTMQALLFGAAGLLPSLSALRECESRSYVRRLRRRWRALQPLPGVSPLHEGDWKFFRLRPVNFPTARLAALCFLLPSLFARGAVKGMLGMLERPGATSREKRSALLAMFRISPDLFWSRHVHFRGRGRGLGIALGRTRVHEIIVNGIVPLLLLHARMEGDVCALRETRAFLRALPASEQNSVTRRVQSLLTGGKFPSCSPLEFQGMLHLYRLYCAKGRCARCPVTAGPAPRRQAEQRIHARGVRMSHRPSQARTSMSQRR